ncbi:MAG: sigma-70 family RNA polymerase sigma factor [Thermoguttaceae bacterium]
MHRCYKYREIAELRDQQVRFAPRDKRLEQATRAEELLAELDDHTEYSWTFLTQRLIDYRSEMNTESRFVGEHLRVDLMLLIEDLTESARLTVEECGERVWFTDELVAKLGVTPKTLTRWRMRDLVAIVVWVNGKRRVAFRDRVVTKWQAVHAEHLRRSHDFSRMSTSERETIIVAARRLAFSGGTPTDVASFLARIFGRSRETIRYTLRQFDAAHPHCAVFPNRRRRLLPAAYRELVAERKRGATIDALANRFDVSRTSVYRFLAINKLEEIALLPLRFQGITPSELEPSELNDAPSSHDAIVCGKSRVRHSRVLGGNPEHTAEANAIATFAQANPNAFALGPRRVRGGDEFEVNREQIPHADTVPDFQEVSFHVDSDDTTLLTPDEEVALFRRMNRLKCRAATLREGVDPKNPRPATLTLIQELYDESVAIKKRIAAANVRLVYHTAQRHRSSYTSRDIDTLISDGQLVLLEAIETFNPARGNKFSSYVTWALMRAFARPPGRRPLPISPDANVAVVPDYHRAEFGTESREAAALAAAISVDDLLEQLTPRERTILTQRFGIGVADVPTLTLQELATMLNLSSERVRQLASRSLERLRNIAEDDAEMV